MARVKRATNARKDRKGNFRRLWIQRINAAARANGMTYNRFIQGLRVAGVEVDRRMLAELAVADEAAFSALVEVAKKAIPDASGSAAPWVRGTASPGTGSYPGVPSPRLKAARRLNKRAFRQRERAFLAEGPQAVAEAFHCGAQVTDLFVTVPARTRHGDLVAAIATAGIPVHVVSGEVMDELAQTVTPQGLLAVCGFVDVPLDPYSGKCVRASAGSLFHLPVVAGTRLEEAVVSLREAGLRIVAADGRAGRPLGDPQGQAP